MTVGSVTADREATIDLTVANAGGQQGTLAAVIDTGFTGWLTLPPAVIAALSLTRIGARRATLADGTDVDRNLYSVTVTWDGQPVDLFALEAEGEPLVGMALLYGYVLMVHVVDGGDVHLQALP